MTLEKMTAEHLDDVAGLEVMCFSEPWTKALISGSLARRDFCGLVLKEKEKTVGYICGTCLFETGEVARIAVAPFCRRKGFGELLLGEFCSLCKSLGAEQVFLEVRASNVPAVALYEKLAFEKTRVRERYYVDGEDALEMRKVL